MVSSFGQWRSHCLNRLYQAGVTDPVTPKKKVVFSKLYFATTNRKKNGMENGRIATTLILYRAQGIIRQEIPTAINLPRSAIIEP
jgi:hypothetical protein